MRRASPAVTAWYDPRMICRFSAVMARRLLACVFVLLGAGCTPQQVLMSALVPDGAGSMLLSHLQSVEGPHRQNGVCRRLGIHRPAGEIPARVRHFAERTGECDCDDRLKQEHNFFVTESRLQTSLLHGLCISYQRVALVRLRFAVITSRITRRQKRAKPAGAGRVHADVMRHLVELASEMSCLPAPNACWYARVIGGSPESCR